MDDTYPEVQQVRGRLVKRLEETMVQVTDYTKLMTSSHKHVLLYMIRDGIHNYHRTVYYCDNTLPFSTFTVRYQTSKGVNEHNYEIRGENTKPFLVAYAFYGFYVYEECRFRSHDKEYKYGRLVRRKLLQVNALEHRYDLKAHAFLFVQEGPKKGFKLPAGESVSGYDIMRGVLWRVQNRLDRIDKEYFNTDVVPQPEPLTEPLSEDIIEEDVYQLFKKYVNLKQTGYNSIISGRYSLKVHDATIGDLQKVYDAFHGVEVPYHTLEGGYTYGCVFKSCKTNGYRRRVYPMSPKTNMYISQTFGDQEHNLPDTVELIKGPNFKPFKYSYDVSSCDQKLLPYFRRLLREEFPDAVDKVLGKAYTLDEGYFDLPQFPSGVCKFMKYTTSAFTSAIVHAKYPGLRIQVQGDGVACDMQLQITNLVEQPKGVINGFRYDGNGFEYVNGHKRLTTPHIMHSKRIGGDYLWQLRRQIYIRFLNSKVSGLPFRDTDIYRKLQRKTDQEIVRIASDYNVCKRLLAELEYTKEWVSSEKGDDNCAGWAGTDSTGFII